MTDRPAQHPEPDDGGDGDRDGHDGRDHVEFDDHHVDDDSTHDDHVELTPPRPLGSTRRRTAIVAAVASVSVLATIAGFAALSSTERAGPEQVSAATGDDDAAGPVGDATGSASPDEEIEVVLTALLDPTVPAEERAALIESPTRAGGPSTIEVIASIDRLLERAGVSDLGAIEVRDRWGDTARVDLTVDLTSPIAGAARLASIILRVDDGGWRVTAESLCGLDAAGSWLALPAVCSMDPEVRTTDGALEAAALYDDAAGRPVEPGSDVALGLWNADVEVIDGVAWTIEYPELELGGGGPVGPANVIATDVRTGDRLTGISLSGTDAHMVLADGSLWVLHQPIPGTEDAPPSRLTRIDPALRVVSAETALDGQVWWIRPGGTGVWVVADARADRYEGGELRRVARVELGAHDADTVAADSTGRLWVPRVGAPALVADADGAVREVQIPPGQVVASAEQLWAIDTTTDGVVARSFGADGAVSAEVRLGGYAVVDTIWGDGAGGVWVAAGFPTSYEATSATNVAVTSRPIATHIDPTGTVDSTWWATSTAGSAWFVGLDTGIALSVDGHLLALG